MEQRKGSQQSRPQTQAQAQDPPRLRDVDGCAPELYRFLWSSKGTTGETCKGLHLPDTLVLGPSGTIRDWFFTSKKTKTATTSAAAVARPASGRGRGRGTGTRVACSSARQDKGGDLELLGSGPKILKKHARHCTGQKVLEEWSKELRKGNRAPTDCNAVLLYPSGEPSPHLSPDTWTTVQYLDWFATEHLFEQGPSALPKHGGILQRYIHNKAESSNSVICATWSPKLCLVERRVNCNKAGDSQIPLFSRMATFEGKESFRLSTSAPLSGTKIAALVQEACTNIVEHVKEVSNSVYNIVRLVAYFKVDSKFNVSFLWCSSLRLEHRIPRQVALSMNMNMNMNMKNLGTSELQRQHQFASLSINLDPNIRVKRGMTVCRRQGKKFFRSGEFTCPSCSQSFEHRERCEVMYKTVIGHFEKRGGGGGGGEVGASRKDEKVVPSVLQVVEGPSLNWKRYEVVMDNPAFLYKVCYLCIECCLEYTSTALEDLSTANPASTMVGMTREFSEPELKSYNILQIMMNLEEEEVEESGEDVAARKNKSRRPQSASRVKTTREAKMRKENNVLQPRPNSVALANRRGLKPSPTDQSRNETNANGALEGNWVDDLEKNTNLQQAMLNGSTLNPFLAGMDLEEPSPSRSELGIIDTSEEIPMERLMKINNLTVEELDYLKTVLD